MEDFGSTIDERIRELSSRDTQTRLAAVQYLGEVGALEAIDEIVRLYENDRNGKVRSAAKYALGQFRAIELALERKQEVVLDGTIGKRLKLRPAALMGINVLLLLVLAGLVVANMTVPPRVQPDNDEATVRAEIERHFNHGRDDALSLQQQYLTVLNGGTLDCRAFFNNPQPYSMSDNDRTVYPALAQLADQVNAAIADLEAVRLPFVQGCSPTSQTLSTDQVNAVLRDSSALVTTFTNLDTAINPPTPTFAPTIAPAEATPTEEATPEGSFTGLEAHLVPITASIGNLLASNGPVAQLEGYANDLVQAGRTQGCDRGLPTIPEDYVLPAETVAESPDLARIVEEYYNTGLATLRDGWTAFFRACQGGNQAQAAANLAAVARVAFETAEQQLGLLIQGGVKHGPQQNQ